MVKLAFATDNAAFEENSPVECARILRAVADAVQSGHGNGNIRDINGNVIGSYDVDAPDDNSKP